MLTTPVVMTWPDSTPVTRVIGRKIHAAADHLDHQAQDARRPSADPQHRHQITDPADLVPVRVKNGDAGQVRDEDPGVTAAILVLLRPSVSTVSVRSA